MNIYAISLIVQPFYLTMWIITFDVTFMAMVYFLIMYIMIKFIKKTNSIILNINDPNKLFQSNITILDSVHKFIMLHNHFLIITYKINFLCSKLLLACLFLFMPFNLITIHLLFFENTAIETKFWFFFVAFNYSVTMIFIIYVMAYLSNRTTVHLSRLQWRINGQPFGLRHKIKLMSYSERLSSNRKIGINIGPTVTLTMNLFAQVLIYKNNRLFIHN